MPRYLPRRGLTLSLNRWWNLVGRVGANGAASWEFYGILNAAGGLSRFAACDTGSFPERGMALFGIGITATDRFTSCEWNRAL